MGADVWEITLEMKRVTTASKNAPQLTVTTAFNLITFTTYVKGNEGSNSDNSKHIFEVFGHISLYARTPDYKTSKTKLTCVSYFNATIHANTVEAAIF